MLLNNTQNGASPLKFDAHGEIILVHSYLLQFGSKRADEGEVKDHKMSE